MRMMMMMKGNIFIAVEQHLTLKTDNLLAASYLLLASHYVNMDYYSKAKDVLTFLATNVGGITVSGYKWGHWWPHMLVVCADSTKIKIKLIWRKPIN